MGRHTYRGLFIITLAYQLAGDTKGFNWPEKVIQMAVKGGGGHNNIS